MLDQAAMVGAAATVLAAMGATWYARRASPSDLSRESFVRARGELSDHRADLTQEALDWYADRNFPGLLCSPPELPGMLTQRKWLPPKPVRLQSVGGVYVADAAPIGTRSTKILDIARKQLPLGPAGIHLTGYSDAMKSYCPPEPFENWMCYRLIDADLTDESHPELRFGHNYYFRSIDESEAVAQEFANDSLSRRKFAFGRRLPQRRCVGNPIDLENRNTIFAISALTLLTYPDGPPKFFLHKRNDEKVAIAGKLNHLLPSGVHQPTASDPTARVAEAPLWYTLCREYAEEILLLPEARGGSETSLLKKYQEGPIGAINAAFQRGDLKVYALGLGLDPLTLCAELVTVAVVPHDVFFQIFHHLPTANAEGTLQLKSGDEGFDFSEEWIWEFVDRNNASPATKAALSRAWHFRSELLDGNV